MKIYSRLKKYLTNETKERKKKNKNSKTFLLKIFLMLAMIEASINSEIHLVIQGNGEQKLLNDIYFTNFKRPSEVLVNGVKDDSCSKTCNLEGDRNNITLKFDTQIEPCNSMFELLTNIIEIDLSNFDASKVRNMRWMFYSCSNLKKIEFGNINTPSLENMAGMFQGFSKLKLVDLSNLDTSKVQDIMKLERSKYFKLLLLPNIHSILLTF